jgi:prophage regulatory protein
MSASTEGCVTHEIGDTIVQKFLRRSEVEKITGLPRSSIYERMAAGHFPKPVPLGGRSVAWLEAEIIDWQKKRIADRDRKRLGGKRRRHV